LSYLRKFPIDALKIDQSFVRQISTAGDDTTLVAAVISMARNLKLRVIAEGVENVEELKFLQAHQCDEAQGYYFSRPVPAQQFADLLENGLSDIDLVPRLGPGSELGEAQVRRARRSAVVSDLRVLSTGLAGERKS
jgi:predicted signal transduction protein with EAL and GGDEF domain